MMTKGKQEPIRVAKYYSLNKEKLKEGIAELRKLADELEEGLK